MKDLFVPYDIALIAKNNNFNGECLTYFLNENLQRIDGFGITNDLFDEDDSRIVAPLYQQLVDWFRIKHKIIIWIETATYVTTFNFRFYIETDDDKVEGMKSNDYYELYNDALKEAFNLIQRST